MPSPLPQWGYETPVPEYFEPSEKELKNLFDAFSEEFIANKKEFVPTADFKKYVRRLIIIYRMHTAIAESHPKDADLIRELEVLQTLIEKTLITYFDEKKGLSRPTKILMAQRILMDYEKYGDDIMGIYGASANAVLEIIDDVIANIKKKNHRKPEPKYVWRQLVAEEFARLFEKELGIKPSKTRNGLFDNCFKILLEHMQFLDAKYTVDEKVPEDSYKIIAAAIDAYPQKEMSDYIKLQIYPNF